MEKATYERLIQMLYAEFGNRIERISLFGSRARDEGRDDSDIDILIVVRSLTRKDRERIIDVTSDLSLENELILSPLIVDYSYWVVNPELHHRFASEGTVR